MQVQRPPRYDPIVQEKCLQDQVSHLLQEEQQCVAGIVSQQKRRKWPLIALVNIVILCLVENEKMVLLWKKTMMTTSQIARDLSCPPTPTGDVHRVIGQLQEQQRNLQSEFAKMAASLQALQDEIARGNCSEQENPLAKETKKRMEQMANTEADLARKVQELQNAVEILGQQKKSARRPLPLLTAEVEVPKNYHTPTAASQAKEPQGKYAVPF